MAVDVATLALELDTSGMARGERAASQLADKVINHYQRIEQRMKAINRTIGDAFNPSGGDARTTQRFSQSEVKFSQHQARLQQIAAQSSARLAEIEARRLAQLEAIRERAAQQELARQRRLERQAQQGGRFGAFLRNSSTIREAGESIGNTGIGLTLLTDKFIALGRAAVRSAVDIDTNVNVLKAFLGSTQAAEARLTQLINISQKTPGLTTKLASTLDAQLRTSNVSQGTIDKILPSIGRLNAVSPLGDPQKFAQNLQQLITQGFERADLKELVGQSPIAGQILQQLFSVDSPTNSKAIRESTKKLGIATTDQFFAAFADAASKNKALANVTESLGTRIEKIVDRVNVAFRPLGLSIIKALEPIVERAIPLIERLSKAFDALPDSTKTAIIGIAGLAATVGPALIVLGGFVQSLGAAGNLVKAFLTISGAGTGAAAGTGIAATLGTIATVLGVVVVAVAGLYAAWKTNFAGIRDITADVLKEASGLFGELRQFWAEIAPDIKAITRDLFSGINDIIKFYSGLYGSVWREVWEFFKTTVREAVDVIRPAITSILSLIRGDFEGFARDSRRLWQETWDFIVMLPARAFNSLLKIVEDGLTSLLTTTGFARNIGMDIGGNLGKGIVDGFVEIAASKSTSILIRGFLEGIRGNNGQRDAARQAQREANANRGLDGEEITGAQLSQNKATIFAPTLPKLTGLGGGKSNSKAESAARQLRGAEEELARATAKARLDIEENTLKKIIDLDKDSFDKRLVSADAYYERLIQNELKLQDVERQRVQAELSASQARLAGAKAGSPEALREKAQQIELEARLSILETERAGTVRKLNDELLKLKTTEKERNDELLKSGAIVGFDANKKFLDKFFGQQDARRDRPESQLRIKETEIQALGNAGLLREQQVTDALILTRRSYREELVKSAEARREEARAAAESEGKFFDSSRFEEEIAGLKAIGSELTRAEALQKRFAEQGVLDYSRLNEGVEDLLASQKGLTEIFSDFRANLVKDQFDLIDSGVDKLTKNLGVLGSAFGTLLKDLARLAASAILKKLLGIDGGQSSLLGFGNASARSASPVSGLGNLITGGGGASGGGGSFLTGGFAGGNPAQAALGGGNGGGIAQKLLSKIPGIGRFFGSSPTAAGSAGASQGIGSSAASLGKAATGIGTQAPGLLASLGATGLLAGGGIGGSLLGGNSQIGRLLGGAGGSLLGGFAAASLINPALLPAFFSNPITAVIGGALIGGALLFRFFGDREFRKFRKEAEKQYQIKVDGKQSGRELYKAEKELGEQMFGKGKFGSKIVETIRSKKGQQLLADYANANGQENNPLARKFRDKTELTDISDPRNRFTRRAMGGSVTAGMPYIVGDGGRPEVFSSRISGEVFPSIKQFEKQLLIALQSSQALGGIFGGAKQQLINQLATRTESQSGSGAPAEFHAAMKMVMGVNVRLAEALNRFESMPAEQVVTTGARKAPTAIAEAVHTSMKQSSAPGLAIKQEVFKGR